MRLPSLFLKQSGGRRSCEGVGAEVVGGLYHGGVVFGVDAGVDAVAGGDDQAAVGGAVLDAFFNGGDDLFFGAVAE